MKICYIVNINSIHARRWISPLIENGHQVYIVSYQERHTEFPGVAGFIDLTKISNRGKIRFLQWGLWLKKYLDELQPDILHAHFIPGAGWLAAMSGFKPLILTCWGSDLLVEPNRSLVRRLLVKLVLYRTQALTVPSKIMYEKALQLGYPKGCLHLIPWGVETDTYTPISDDSLQTKVEFGIPVDVQVILSPRRIHPICNHDTVLDAFSSLRNTGVQAHLVFVDFRSIPETHAYLKAKISELQFADCVHWLPAQEDPYQMAKLYRMADVVISIPSSEGYGFTTFEAMACGTPTVVSDLPVFENELEDRVHTIKIPARDITKTQLALTMILSNSDFSRKLSQAGIKKARNYSTQYRIDQTEKLYQTIRKSLTS